MDVEKVRSQFPGLSQDLIFLDNAAGSQMVQSCSGSIHYYLTHCNVQPAFDYPVSREATARLEEGHAAAARYINASSDELVFGASTTSLVRNVSTSFIFGAGDNIVLSKLEHEAHLAGWVHAARLKGVEVRWWVPRKDTGANPKLELKDLEAQNLVDENTRLVAFTHTSNVLGSIADVAALSQGIKKMNPKTLVSVDAVAYAPHGKIDVKAFGVDFYFLSWYKVYGPHMASAYVRKEAQFQFDSLGHYFMASDSATNILGLGAGNYELVQSVPAITAYVDSVGWDWITAQEEALQTELLNFISTRSEIQLYGEPKPSRALRVPVISFRVYGWSSQAFVKAIYETSNCAPTASNFYARRLCEEVLGVDPEDGLIRCSLLHYNTVDEVKSFIRVLEAILVGGKD